MVLVVVAEVETGDQRQEPAKFVRARVVPITKWPLFMAVRQEGPEVE